jgi:hypothetical protein
MSVTCDGPSPPIWPNQFTVPFKETYTVDYIRRIVHATYWYDNSRNLTRVDRDNGQYDLFCSGIVKDEALPCQQFVTRGWRYITYGDKLQNCCACCNASNGCDVLKRNWMDGSEFVGYDEIEGMKVGKWLSKKDVVDRVYIYTVDEYVPVVSWVGSDVYQEYDFKQYVEHIADLSVFDLPKQCNQQSPLCPGVCAEVRI